MDIPCYLPVLARQTPPVVLTMSEPTSQTTISPHNQQPLVTRSYPSQDELSVAIQRSAAAQKVWARAPLQERIAVGKRFMVGVLQQSCYTNAEGTARMSFAT